MTSRIKTLIYQSGANVLRAAMLTGAIFISLAPSSALAQNNHAHAPAAQPYVASGKAQASVDTLINIVREATDRFQSVAAAEAEGYALQFGCVTGSDEGAMGLHYVNGKLVEAGELDPKRPQIVIYEPLPDGSLKLIGADYLVLADVWNAKHSAPPEMMGQLFHLFESPNRFGLPAFYTLHVWAWKDNPKGAYVNWHPHVSCNSFATQSK